MICESESLSFEASLATLALAFFQFLLVFKDSRTYALPFQPATKPSYEG